MHNLINCSSYVVGYLNAATQHGKGLTHDEVCDLYERLNKAMNGDCRVTKDPININNYIPGQKT